MKISIITFLCGISFIAAGCGVLGGSGMSLKYNGQETRIEPKAAFVAPNSAGGHSIQITNYPVEMGNSYDYSKISAKADGQYRLDVMILKQKANDKQPVAAGEYKYQDSKEEPKDKIVRATVYRFEGGKEVPVELDNKNIKGMVKITSVEGDTVKGNIDIDDGKSAIKGDFTGRTLQ